jgi:hypothetical protein
VFQGLPRTLIAFGAVLIVLLELVTRLPDILLLPQRLQGQMGELGAKAMQPQVVTTQVAKTEADTRLADAQAQLNTIQQSKVAAETEVTKLQAMVTAMQVAKTQADTRLADMQAALAASQATKTDAETKLAQAQTNKTNIETTQQTVGLALTVGMLALGAKAIGAFASSDQPTQQATQQTEQPPASPYEAGRADWHKWYDWGVTLRGDQLAGAEYWADVRSRKPQPSCASAPQGNAADFQSACDTARKYLSAVDKLRHDNDDYRQGWTAGFKETGGF